MRKMIAAAVLSLIALPAYGKDKVYEKATLMRMESTPCGHAESDGKTLKGQILGTDGEHKNIRETLCAEYILRADRVIYKIRPKDDKHPVLLPIGETAEFRIQKDKLLLRVPEANDKEREYSVVSIIPRDDVTDTRAAKDSSH